MFHNSALLNIFLKRFLVKKTFFYSYRICLKTFLINRKDFKRATCVWKVCSLVKIFFYSYKIFWKRFFINRKKFNRTLCLQNFFTSGEKKNFYSFDDSMCTNGLKFWCSTMKNFYSFNNSTCNNGLKVYATNNATRVHNFHMCMLKFWYAAQQGYITFICIY